MEDSNSYLTIEDFKDRDLSKLEKADPLDWLCIAVEKASEKLENEQKNKPCTNTTSSMVMSQQRPHPFVPHQSQTSTNRHRIPADHLSYQPQSQGPQPRGPQGPQPRVPQPRGPQPQVPQPRVPQQQSPQPRVSHPRGPQLEEPLPDEYVQKIRYMNGYDTSLVIAKPLTNSDVSRDQSRMSMPIRQCNEVDLSSVGKGVNVKVIKQDDKNNLDIVNVMFGKYNDSYVFNKNWYSDFVKTKNGKGILEKGDKVQVWSFRIPTIMPSNPNGVVHDRMNDKYGFAIVKLSKINS
ncbi:gamma-gliadin B [Spinacia oleracea]|uniref:Gamma-gliadin B n=1 Tax=Spinacia oleracea TaxID=3562 RepID=A0A9R0IM54_SPIOL|nr:gamma-gliadin B [Spinacia oleracea]